MCHTTNHCCICTFDNEDVMAPNYGILILISLEFQANTRFRLCALDLRCVCVCVGVCSVHAMHIDCVLSSFM